jgi:hypothetical protein
MPYKIYYLKGCMSQRVRGFIENLEKMTGRIVKAQETRGERRRNK